LIPKSLKQIRSFKLVGGVVERVRSLVGGEKIKKKGFPHPKGRNTKRQSGCTGTQRMGVDLNVEKKRKRGGGSAAKSRSGKGGWAVAKKIAISTTARAGGPPGSPQKADGGRKDVDAGRPTETGI